MGLESPSHWLIVALVVLVLFGYKKLPEMSRSVGRSLRIFKTEMKGMGEDDSVRDGTSEQPQPQAAWTAPAVSAAPAVPAVPVNPPTAEASLSATAPAVPPVAVPPAAPAAEAPREAPQQQA